MNELFHKVAVKVSNAVGTPKAFIVALLAIVAWALSGSIFDFSNTWQLVINTVTTIVTLLMVFLIQNTQNRDARAMHLKLDELINSVKGARKNLVDLEEFTDKELDELQEQFRSLHQRLSDKQKSKDSKSNKSSA